MINQLKEYLKLEQIDTKANALLPRFIEESQAIIETECGQPLFDTVVNYTAYGSGSDTLVLPFHEVTEINSITQNGDVISVYLDKIGSVYHAVTVSNDVVFDRSLRYTISLDVGFKVVPKDLQAVILDVSAQKYREYLDGTLGVSQKQTAGDGAIVSTITYKEVINRHAGTIRKYTRITF